MIGSVADFNEQALGEARRMIQAILGGRGVNDMTPDMYWNRGRRALLVGYANAAAKYPQTAPKAKIVADLVEFYDAAWARPPDADLYAVELEDLPL